MPDSDIPFLPVHSEVHPELTICPSCSGRAAQTGEYPSVSEHAECYSSHRPGLTEQGLRCGPGFSLNTGCQLGSMDLEQRPRWLGRLHCLLGAAYQAYADGGVAVVGVGHIRGVVVVDALRHQPQALLQSWEARSPPLLPRQQPCAPGC